VYFPLGGSRVKKKSRLIFNLFVVWFLTGVWHGASWNFIVWGLFYFVILTFEKLLNIPKRFNHNWSRELYRIITILYIIIGWVIFRAKDLKHAIDYLISMAGLNGNTLTNGLTNFLVNDSLIIILIGVLFSIPITSKVKYFCDTYVVFHKMERILSPIIYTMLFIIDISYILNSSYNPFIYFNF
jgi:alginate O-acetyltransferase complex protein AlgI